ncbi:hypothetical protein PHYBOEH_007414 [Phytophthora boehmeriae]|uniref:Myb-like DNA-binding protein n=1 Tax=Phytophthora boehmeriae TaxID=109152 RepID=A0A8T1W7T6_9STRA|nr:hypothetical protein PHYBOEH_007414 [Phytophthora boehmeriae]
MGRLWHPSPTQSGPPPPSDRAPQSGWYPLHESLSEPHPHPQNGWVQEDHYSSAAAGYGMSHDQRTYGPTHMYAPAPTPPYVWTEEPQSESPAGVHPYMAPPSYPRPLPSPVGGIYERPHDPELMGVKPDRRRDNKEISIGRWNSEEHQWFLKGLEMFQGPAWGEIARLIGTRTSTQVRTHAQKFFTKMARLNQTLPFFEVQIQRERARLVAQGASVTPTSQSGPSSSLATTLSPRKRLASASSRNTGNTSPRQTLKSFKEERVMSPTYPPARYSTEDFDHSQRVVSASPVAVSSVTPTDSPPDGPMTKEWPQWTSEDTRQGPQASPTATSASLQHPQVDGIGLQSAPADVDSLPSMNKLLHRSSVV